MAGLSRLLHPEVERHLLASEREFIVYQVQPHWVTRVPGVALVCCGIALLLSMPFIGAGWWLALVAAFVAAAAGFWRIHLENMDRFVVTNMRVFRVNGVLNQKMASVPLARLLDITMSRPLLGQEFNYGHFVFETAAQDQGLQRIGFVPDIENHDLILQTVIQRAGIRASAGEVRAEYDTLLESLEPDGDSARRSRGAGRQRHRRGGADDGT